MAPPNSVAIASPLPTSYFSQAYGVLAGFPSAYTFHGFQQPFPPVAHGDYDSSGRTLRPWPVVTNPAPQPVSGTIGPPIHVTPILSNLRTIVNNLPNLPGRMENPLSWWRRQFLPGIPERGM